MTAYAFHMGYRVHQNTKNIIRRTLGCRIFSSSVFLDLILRFFLFSFSFFLLKDTGLVELCLYDKAEICTKVD
jgi:hypothetical protein